jgi:hypothetical protein
MQRAYTLRIAVLGIGMAAGNGYAGSPAVILPTTTDVYVKVSESISLDPSHGVRTTILSVTLPPGKWVITSTASLFLFQAFEINHCHLLTNDFPIATVRLVVNSGGSDIKTVTLTGAFECPSNMDIRVECWHETFDVRYPPVVEAGATLWAHKAGELQLFAQ